MSDAKDPLDTSTYYTYLVNTNQSKFQLLSFLEDGSNVSLSFQNAINTAYADPNDYSKRFPSTKGDALGIILASGTLVPVQASGTGVDIVTTQT